MANENNLKPAFDKLTPKEHREIASKGGKASAKTRAKNKKIKDKLKLLLSLPIIDDKVEETLKEYGIDPINMDNEMLITLALFKRASTGHVRAIEYIDERMGINPLLNLKQREIEIKEREENKVIDIEDTTLLYEIIHDTKKSEK